MQAVDKKLEDFLKENRKIAIAFSGGVDSSYLLYAAVQCKIDVTAYYVNAAFQPEFELKDAKRIAEITGGRMKVIEVDVLSNEKVVENPSNRCYFCKQSIFSTILEHAKADGYTMVVDGTNASDDSTDRPGMKALQEMQVRSPLRECGLTKKKIRELSKQAGLFTWSKPSYACLATRIPSGTAITAEMLERTERAENFLFSLGFTNFRVRLLNKDIAKLQMPKEALELLMEKREEILAELKKDYSDVLLDLEVRG